MEPLIGYHCSFRDNGKGINGIAVNAEIMVLRAVPDGTNMTKTLPWLYGTLLINGANIINMSFGKSFSTAEKICG